jgi:HSP20 family molecular chaperone IbpA
MSKNAAGRPAAGAGSIVRRSSLLGGLAAGPAVELAIAPQRLLVRMQVDGLGDLEVTSTPTVLTVRGLSQAGGLLFSRKLELPENARVDRASARLCRGVLSIDVPLAPEASLTVAA